MKHSKFFAFVLVGISVLNISSAGVQTTSASESISTKNQAILDRALERYVYAPVAEKNILQKISILETRLAFMEKKLQNPNLSKSASASIEYIVTSISTKIADLRTKTPLYANQEEFKNKVENTLIKDLSFKKEIVAAVEKYYNDQLMNGKYTDFYRSVFLKDNYRNIGITNGKEFAEAMSLFKPRKQVSLLATNIEINKPLDADYSTNDGMYGVSLKITLPTSSCRYRDERLSLDNLSMDRWQDCHNINLVYAMDGKIYTNDTVFPWSSSTIKNKGGSRWNDAMITRNIDNSLSIMTDIMKNRDHTGYCFGNDHTSDCSDISIQLLDGATGKAVKTIASTRQSHEVNNMIFIPAPGLISGKQYFLSVSPVGDKGHPYFYGEFKY